MTLAGGASATSGPPTGSSFNILFSNTQTLLPALIGRLPRPDVRPRWQPKPLVEPIPPQPVGMDMMGQPVMDPAAMQGFMAEAQAFAIARQQDQVTKDAALIIERGLTYTISEYDFLNELRAIATDCLLTGRGVPRIKYEPTTKQTPVLPAPVDPLMMADPAAPPMYLHPETGEPVDPAEVLGAEEGEPYIDELVWEKTTCELVHWNDFRISPAKSWSEVRWVAFRHMLTREDLVEQFGDIGATVPLDQEDDDDEQGKDDNKLSQDSLKRATVWEVWDKGEKTVTFFAPSMDSDEPLSLEADPLGLADFWPIPRPLYAIPSTDSMVPLPEFITYEDQARELNRVTNRINALVKAVKHKGVFNGTASEIASLMKADDGEFVSVENFQVMEGGLAKSIYVLPIGELIKAIDQLYVSREQIKQVIYEITGLADIIRGATDPNETLGAQQLKAQWGSLRIQDRRREVERLVVDLFRMKAEVMATKFDASTLQEMSGVPVTDEIMQFLQNDGLRTYRIDVESDSMVAADRAALQDQTSNLLRGMSEFFNSMAGPVSAGMIPLKAIKALAIAAARNSIAFGREVEDALNEIPDEMPMPMMPGPVGPTGAGPGPQPPPGMPSPQQQAALPPPGMIQ